MALKLYSVSFRWVKTPLKNEYFEPIFGSMGDWMRFSGYSWFLHTQRTQVEIYDTLRVHMHVDDSILIIPISLEPAIGWAPAWIWDWLNSKLPIETRSS
jgi:hypothetical protein